MKVDEAGATYGCHLDKNTEVFMLDFHGEYCKSIHRSIDPAIHPSICLCFYLSIYTYLSVSLSILSCPILSYLSYQSYLSYLSCLILSYPILIKSNPTQSNPIQSNPI